MSPEILSHYSYSQFFLVFFLLISFIGASVHVFFSLYYCKSKLKALLVWIPYILLLMTSVQIETSYNVNQALIYIVLFRILALCLCGVLIFFYSSKRRFLTFIGIIWALSIFCVSFITHYIPLYLTAFFLVVLIKISKPEPMEIIIKKHAGLILNNLKEAVLIISLKKEILHINPYMMNLLRIDLEKATTVKNIEKHLFLKESEINILIKGKKSGHFVKQIENKHLLINYTFMPSKGLILTATDITQSVKLQNEIQQNIQELENLNAKLQNYSQKTETLRIRKEHKELIKYIQGLIKTGMVTLQENLEKLKDKPPESYDTILDECRSLLEQIRLVAKEWRKI